MLKQNNLSITDIDLANSFYVGDAAGRPHGWKQSMKQDHAASDYKFALNVGMKFHTPEEFFHGEQHGEERYLGFDPRSLTSDSLPLYLPTSTPLVSGTQEMVILVGYPASGKSTFAQFHLESEGYIRVNRDTLKSIEKCRKYARAALAQGQSVVVGN
jgi:bifunctional polynucleotide phosphatase/kinase